MASGCTNVAIGNWVLFEYLIWVGLQHEGWHGEIQEIGPFRNDSRVLEHKDFRPCAIVRDHVLFSPVIPPLPGKVERDFGGLLLALTPEAAARAGWTEAPAT